MASESVMHKQDFERFLTLLMEKHAVFGPSCDNDTLGIKKIDSPGQVILHKGPTHFSFKNFFLPQMEILFSFDLMSNKIDSESGKTDDEKYDILVGLRPCDAMAVTLLDLVFVVSDTKDAYYSKRRSRTKIISFACSEPCATCFCEAVGCRPDSEAGADIIMYDIGNRYIMKSLTQAGEELKNGTGMHFDVVKDFDRDEKEQMVINARNQVERVFSVDELDKKLMGFDDPYWNQIQQKCLGCGVCTYFCPTCHCFDITDEKVGSHGRRIRTWDSCMYPLFTLHASGHNPRPTRKERMRQRIMHKFVYSKEQYGKRFCVGCGRCILHCPVNLDLRAVIRDIVEAE